MRHAPTLFVAAAIALAGCSASTPAVDERTPDGPAAPVTPAMSSDDAMAECEDGMAGDYACSNVDLVSHISLDDFGSERGNDIWGWTDPETGIEYALVGLFDGTAFVSLADPANPQNLGKVPTTTEGSVWRDVKTYDDHAFIVSEAPGHGMQVFDLARLRGLTADPDRTFEPDALYEGVGNSHNIVIDDVSGFAYMVGSTPSGDELPAECASKGFHAVDIREPQDPTFVTCFSDAAMELNVRSVAGYTHDAQCLVYDGPDEDYNGRQMCFAANEDVLTIFDVEDKSDIKIVSMAQYPNHAYSHQGWLTQDQRYFLLNDELDEMRGGYETQRTLVFDLLDLDAPEFAYEWDSGIPVIDHNLYMKGDYSFQSNYRAGLRIIDVSRVGEGEMTEAAFFDTYPQSEDIGFGGQWSNYPYFESGIVVANDSNNGLFVLRPNLDEPEL
jgi:choice-of-anchor B domain-containing protein